MRILTVGNMYPPHHLGGYELTWRSAVRHLRDRGHVVRVLTTDHRNATPDGPEEDPDVHRTLRWYWRDHDFPRIGPGARLALERHNADVFDRHVSEFAPDVVSWWAMGGMSMSLIERARRLWLPAVGIVEDDWMVYGPRVDGWTRLLGRLGPAAALAERATGVPARPALGAAGHWIFASERTREAALERHDLPSTEIAHLGIDDALFRPAPARPWGWRLLCLGRIDPRKGIATCIEALALLPAEARLTVAGGGDQRHLVELRERAEGLSLGDRVEFVSRPRGEVPALYAQADALLFAPAWEEPWGLVPLEAMAVGTPVVANGAGGSKEFLRDGCNCLLFERGGGAEALAAAVTRLSHDPQLRETLRAGGFGTAEAHTEAGFNAKVAAAIERAVRT